MSVAAVGRGGEGGGDEGGGGEGGGEDGGGEMEAAVRGWAWGPAVAALLVWIRSEGETASQPEMQWYFSVAVSVSKLYPSVRRMSKRSCSSDVVRPTYVARSGELLKGMPTAAVSTSCDIEKKL